MYILFVCVCVNVLVVVLFCLLLGVHNNANAAINKYTKRDCEFQFNGFPEGSKDTEHKTQQKRATWANNFNKYLKTF